MLEIEKLRGEIAAQNRTARHDEYRLIFTGVGAGAAAMAALIAAWRLLS